MNKEQLTRLCVDYGLGTPARVEANEEGVLNSSYVLTTDKGTFFVKSVRDKKKAHVLYIAEVERFMRSCGIPAVGMLSTKLDKKFVTYGTDLYTVYPFVDSIRTPVYGPSDFQEMGEMLGRIHRAGSTNVPDILREKRFKERPVEWIVGKLYTYKQFIETRSVKDEVDVLFLEYIRLKLEMMSRTAPIKSLPLETLTHGDYHTRNLLLGESRQIVGICDWEQAAMNARSYELARSLHYTCFNGTDEEPNDYENDVATVSARAFLSGYSSQYPISHGELAHGTVLRWKRLVRSFWIEEQYYTNGDARSCKFVPHEMRLILDFADEKIVNDLL